MEEALFGTAQVTTASSSVVPVELPDIRVSDRANVYAKKVTLKKMERTVQQPRECWTGRSPYIRADETKISSVAKRPGLTPLSTSPGYQRSRSGLVSSPGLLRRTDSTGHLLHVPSTPDMDHRRRYSSPNLSLTSIKSSVKQTANLPGSPRSIRGRETQISDYFPMTEGREALPPRAQSFSGNCFGRKNHTPSDSERPFSSSSKATRQTKLQPSFKSVFNDLDMNPVLISPLQLPTSPNNMHRRETGFELRHRVMRRACRLSDLSTAAAPEGPGTRHQEKRSPEFDGTFKKSKVPVPIEEKNSFMKDNNPKSLEEQFKVLQHCRYLRGPVDNQL